MDQFNYLANSTQTVVHTVVPNCTPPATAAVTVPFFSSDKAEKKTWKACTGRRDRWGFYRPSEACNNNKKMASKTCTRLALRQARSTRRPTPVGHHHHLLLPASLSLHPPQIKLRPPPPAHAGPPAPDFCFFIMIYHSLIFILLSPSDLHN